MYESLRGDNSTPEHDILAASISEPRTPDVKDSKVAVKK